MSDETVKDNPESTVRKGTGTTAEEAVENCGQGSPGAKGSATVQTHGGSPRDLGPGEILKSGQTVEGFTEQYSTDSAKRLVEACGGKYRTISPVKMIQMSEDFRIQLTGEMCIAGVAGSFLGINDGLPFILTQEQCERIFKPCKR